MPQPGSIYACNLPRIRGARSPCPDTQIQRHQYREAVRIAIALLDPSGTGFAGLLQCKTRRRSRRVLAVIPGRIVDANPESRDSGFDASHRPGMTVASIHPAAAAGTSRWRFMTILLSAPR